MGILACCISLVTIHMRKMRSGSIVHRWMLNVLSTTLGALTRSNRLFLSMLAAAANRHLDTPLWEAGPKTFLTRGLGRSLERRGRFATVRLEFLRRSFTAHCLKRGVRLAKHSRLLARLPRKRRPAIRRGSLTSSTAT